MDKTAVMLFIAGTTPTIAKTISNIKLNKPT